MQSIKKGFFQNVYDMNLLIIVSIIGIVFYRAVPTHRGSIKMMKFAPGRGNMMLLVLYADGADVWDTQDVSYYYYDDVSYYYFII